MKYIVLLSLFIASICSCQPTGEPSTVEKDTDPNPATKTDPEPTVKKHKEYHENGQLKIEGEMVNGKRHGLWKSFYPDGKKWSETTFENGAKTGRTVTFYENGMMRYQGQYTNNERSGVWKFYNEEGALEKTVDHDEDGMNNGAK